MTMLKILLSSKRKTKKKSTSSKDTTSIAVIKNIETKTGGKVKIIKKERKRITAPSPEKPKPSPSIGTYEKEALKNVERVHGKYWLIFAVMFF